MTTLEEEIVLWLNDHPGARKREIAGAMGMWHCSSEFMNAMHNLEDDGVIRHEVHNDPAQMEFYDEWYVVAP